MKILENLDNDQLTLSLEGNFDEMTSSAVEEKFAEVLPGDAKKICFDLSDVQYISSAGIRVLISAYKKAVKSDKKVTIGNMSDKARGILEVVGILPLFAAGGGNINVR